MHSRERDKENIVFPIVGEDPWTKNWPCIILFIMLFIRWGLEEIYFGGKKIYPAIRCIFISSNGLLSIFNMFVMLFIRGAEGEEISKSWQIISSHKYDKVYFTCRFLAAIFSSYIWMSLRAAARSEAEQETSAHTQQHWTSVSWNLRLLVLTHTHRGHGK